MKSKTVIAFCVLFPSLLVAMYFGIIDFSVGIALEVYLIIELCKRDTQRKVIEASKEVEKATKEVENATKKQSITVKPNHIHDKLLGR